MITQIKNKVSVIMGIYNCADTLKEAIDSILSQTYINWELILCDDCSNDEGKTYSLAKSYQEKFPDKIVLIQNDKNSKLAYTLNHCLQYASGEYIARMDGDDVSLPNRFENQVNYLREHPEVHLVGTAMQRFDDEKKLGKIIKGMDKPDRYSLRYGVPFNHATIMTYKYVFDTLKGYTVAERTMRAQDYDLWFRFYYNEFVGVNLQEVYYLVRENKKAVRRRSPWVRWKIFPTTVYGFRLLNYPKHWIVFSFIKCLVKCIVPYCFIDIYRKIQK